VKIIFLCSCLEAGKDGVGDYTRRLAIELIKSGNETAVVALNDSYSDELFDGVQADDNIELPVLRLPISLTNSQRYNKAGKWINDFKPELLSLQFVPFSFHPKGLSTTLHTDLKKLGGNRTWHIMFHELWVGVGQEFNLKLFCWGSAQKWLIKNLIKHLRPQVIHTQTRLYQKELYRLGFASKHLPLFSNIPVIDTGLKHNASDNDQLQFVLFGGIHFGAPVQEFAKELFEYSQKNKVDIVLKIAGRCGSQQNSWVKTFQWAGLRVKVLGEQSASEISRILGASSFGIATTPYFLIEKSGAVAAMTEHGLPVINVSRNCSNKKSKQFMPRYGVYKYEPGNLDDIINRKQKINSGGVETVAKDFIQSVEIFANV
jgi:hypothetical protein